MNKIFRHTLSFLAIAAALSFSSCNSLVHDDESECPEGMIIQLEPKYAARSSFEAEVSDVRIFIYDSNDVQVSVIDVNGEQLAANNYCVTTNLPVGNYRLVVWNGLSDSVNYTEREAAVSLNTYNDNSTDRSFKPLWHGAVNDIAVENLSLTHVTVPMVKDTNNFVIFLCTTDGSILNSDDFAFCITAENGSMAQDNSLIPGKQITYNNFVCRDDVIEGSLASDLAPTDELGQLHLVRGELNSLRLTTEKEAYLQLFYKNTGHNILKINLNDYILRAFRSDAAGATMTSQVYLDTEDLFNITFFLTPRNDGDSPSAVNDEPVYYCATLAINKWILRIQEPILE